RAGGGPGARRAAARAGCREAVRGRRRRVLLAPGPAARRRARAARAAAAPGALPRRAGRRPRGRAGPAGRRALAQGGAVDQAKPLPLTFETAIEAATATTLSARHARNPSAGVLRASAARIANAAIAPPIRPPMCAPTEIPASVKLSTRF